MWNDLVGFVVRQCGWLRNVMTCDVMSCDPMCNFDGMLCGCDVLWLVVTTRDSMRCGCVIGELGVNVLWGPITAKPWRATVPRLRNTRWCSVLHWNYGIHVNAGSCQYIAQSDLWDAKHAGTTTFTLDTW